LAAVPGFPDDLRYFRLWGATIASGGPEDFYASKGLHNYPPGYMYVLWLLGELDEKIGFDRSEWDYLLKLPSILADLGSAYLLYLLLAGLTARERLGAAALYLLFPAALLVGAIWGQVDSILAFLVLLAVYLLDRGRPLAGALAFTLGFLVKPQALAALPFLIFWVVRDHRPLWWRIRANVRVPMPPMLWLRMIGASMSVALIVALPFFPSPLLWRPIVDLVHQVKHAATEFYPINSSYAYNFWQLLGIARRCDVPVCRDKGTGVVSDGTDFLGLTTRHWGLALFAISAAAVIVVLRKARGPGFLALGTSLCMLAFFVFMTRMHERYLFPFFLPFLAACFLLRSRVLWTVLVALGSVHLLNVWFLYRIPEGTALKVGWLADRLYPELWVTGLSTGRAFALIVVGGFMAALWETYRLAPRR
jgi:dolichyl-phosphate-mannose-protein mannosyltransferase